MKLSVKERYKLMNKRWALEEHCEKFPKDKDAKKKLEKLRRK